MIIFDKKKTEVKIVGVLILIFAFFIIAENLKEPIIKIFGNTKNKILGTESCTYNVTTSQSLQEVINTATENSIICLGEGIYNAPITINKKIILQGLDREKTVIKYLDNKNLLADINNTNGVVIRNIWFQGDYNTVYGLKANNCTSCVFSNLKITNTDFQLYVENGNNVLIENNLIQGGTDIGIKLINTEGGKIINNKILSNDLWGIYYTNVNATEIRTNEIYDSSVGVRFGCSNNNNLSENNIHNNNEGIIIDREYVKGLPCSIPINNNVFNNIVQNNYNGVILRQANTNILNNNQINNNYEYGVVIFWESSANNISNNTISGNGRDPIKEIKSINNVFSNNTLTDNQKNQLPAFPYEDINGYKYFFGDVHTHTNYSDGQGGTNEMAHTWAKDILSLGFFSSSDHSQTHFQPEVSAMDDWEKIKRQADNYYQPGVFVTFPSYEWTSSAHHNILFKNTADNPPYYASGYNDKSYDINNSSATPPAGFPPIISGVAEIWTALNNWQGTTSNNEVLTIPHHSRISVYYFDNIAPNIKIRPLIEITSDHGQSEYPGGLPRIRTWRKPVCAFTKNVCGGRENEGYMQYGMAKAITDTGINESYVMGITASSDSHNTIPGEWGLLAVYAKDLTREGIFEALKNRRVVATSGRKIFLDIKANGHYMGEVFTASDKPTFIGRVDGTANISKIEIVKYQNGSTIPFPVVYTELPNQKGADINFIDNNFLKPALYYLRVTQEDGEMAWSSPFYINKGSKSISPTPTTTPAIKVVIVDKSGSPVTVSGICRMDCTLSTTPYCTNVGSCSGCKANLSNTIAPYYGNNCRGVKVQDPNLVVLGVTPQYNGVNSTVDSPQYSSNCLNSPTNTGCLYWNNKFSTGIHTARYVVATVTPTRPPLPNCPLGQNLLANPDFNTSASGWSFWNGQNSSGSYDTGGAVKIISSGSSNACYSQDISGVRGKYIEFSGSLARTNTSMASNPYLALKAYPDNGSVIDNYGGIISFTGTEAFPQFTVVSKKMRIPSNINTLKVHFCVWNAPAATSYANWLSICVVPSPTPTRPPQTPILTPIPTPKPSTLISNLSVADSGNASDWSVRTNLQTGNTQYGDRAYTFTTVPSLVAGAGWIRTVNDSKTYTGSTLVSFKVNQNATVYVAYNDAIGGKPSWLSGWVDTNSDLINSESTPKKFSLYSKSFNTGSTVSLGNNNNTGKSLYTIVVVKR